LIIWRKKGHFWTGTNYDPLAAPAAAHPNRTCGGVVKEFFEIKGLTFEELKNETERIKKEGRTPFFHFTDRAGAILNGPLIDEIIGDLYAMYDKNWHEAYIVPNRYKRDVEREIEGYSG